MGSRRNFIRTAGLATAIGFSGFETVFAGTKDKSRNLQEVV